MTAAAQIDEAERLVVEAAVLWVNDQACSNALACLEDAVAEVLRLRRERIVQEPERARLLAKLTGRTAEAAE